MEFFLRGGLLGSCSLIPRPGDGLRTPGGGLRELVGLALALTTPAATVLFVDATPDVGESRDPTALLFKDIKAQIEAEENTLEVVNIDGRIGIVEKTPTSGLVLAAATTDDEKKVRTLLGLPIHAVTTKVYNPPGGAAPRVELYSVQQSALSILTWE